MGKSRTLASSGENHLIKVTIGLCVKNNEKTVREAIDSIVNQDFPSEYMEIIIVDGGSQDRTMSIIADSVSKADAQVKMYSDEGKGLGVARQKVVDKAKGEYIVWIDGDVMVPKDFVRKQVDYMEQKPWVGVAPGKIEYTEGTFVATIQNLFQCTLKQMIGTDATIYRVESIRQVGGFDRNIKGADEDTDIILRIKAKGWSICINQKAKWYHHCRDTLRDLWDEHFWTGYGDHYICHKHKAFKLIRHQIPFLYFVVGLQHSLRAYELAHQKKAFLIPFLCFFKGIGWSFGFAKAHIDHYEPPKRNKLKKVSWL